MGSTDDFSGDPAAADAIYLAIVGEPPYAEGKGDSGTLGLPAGENRVLRRLERDCAKMVVIIVSGRPVVVTDHIDQWDALVAAWLPGTEGQDVAETILRPLRSQLRSAPVFAGDDLGIAQIWGYRICLPANSSGTIFLDRLRLEQPSCVPLQAGLAMMARAVLGLADYPFLKGDGQSIDLR